MQQNRGTRRVRKPQHENFGHEVSNLLGWKIHNRRHLPAHELLGSVMDRQLRIFFPGSDLRAEIDLELDCRTTRLGKRLGIDNRPDPDIHLGKILE